jgi:enoyl-CoA hydratase
MSVDILVQDDGSIVRITLNRPEHGNAVTDAMAAELIEAFEAASQRARLIVLRGAGDDYCVGRATMGKAPPAVKVEALERRRQNDIVFNCYDAFRRARIPVLSVVRGRAFGFGCAIASLSDITIASDTATFQIPEMLHNIMPTMVMSAMVDRVPRKALSYLVYSNAVVNADRALTYGIASEIVPDADLDVAVERVAAAIVKAPAPATEGVKEYLRTALTMDIAGAIDYARNLHATINSSSEMRPKPAEPSGKS